MNSKIFVTDSEIREDTGGGIVSKNLLVALNNLDSIKSVVIDRKSVDCDLNSQPFNPFLLDYFSSKRVPFGLYKLALFYGAPFAETAHRIKLFSPTVTTIADVAPHNIDESSLEHKNHGILFNYPHLVNQHLWNLYCLHITQADKIVVHSKKSVDYLSAKANASRDKFVVIPHGCYVPFGFTEYPVDFTVGHLGSNGMDKGQVYFVKAISEVAKTNKPFSAIIAGIGTEYWKSYGGVGWVKDETEVFKACTVYIQPSITEGFGIPALTAMAYKRPVIVSSGAGVSELVKDGYNGFIVEPRNVRAISDYIIYFMDNPSEIKRMGENAYSTSLKWTWDVVNREYVKLFRSLVP